MTNGNGRSTEPVTIEPAQQPYHQLIRLNLLNEQWCTAGTKEELAGFIRDGMIRSLGEYMGDRYSVEDITERLSDPVVCAGDPKHRHYLFDAGRIHYSEE